MACDCVILLLWLAKHSYELQNFFSISVLQLLRLWTCQNQTITVKHQYWKQCIVSSFFSNEPFPLQFDFFFFLFQIFSKFRANILFLPNYFSVYYPSLYKLIHPGLSIAVISGKYLSFLTPHIWVNCFFYYIRYEVILV